VRHWLADDVAEGEEVGDDRRAELASVREGLGVVGGTSPLRPAIDGQVAPRDQNGPPNRTNPPFTMPPWAAWTARSRGIPPDAPFFERHSAYAMVAGPE
jgi:hypothetical protein